MEKCAGELVDVTVDYDCLIEEPAVRLVQHLARSVSESMLVS